MAKKRRGSASTSTSTSAAPRRKRAATANVVELSDELIVVILLGLPAKSLFRFRCVCKSWDAHFSDPHFLKQHSNSPHRQSAHLKLMMKMTKRATLSDQRALQSFGVPALCSGKSRGEGEGQYLGLPITINDVYPTIVGCCNGVFCFKVRRDGETIFFWNPLANQCIRLPYTFSLYYYVNGVPFGYAYGNLLGFGFDDSTNEFKLVRIFIDYSTKPAKRVVEVYGVWEGSRKRIADFPYERPQHMPWTCSYSAVWVNGALHWIATSVLNENKNKTSWVIAAFNIAKQTFETVFLPDPVGIWDYDLRLYCVGELLSFVHSSPQGDNDDVWIMKEYGVKESWTKLLTIPFLNPSNLTPKPPSLPLYYSEMNGELLMIYHGLLVVYCSTDGSICDVGISRLFKSCTFNSLMCTYVESLFTPAVLMRLRGESNNQQSRFRIQSEDPETGVRTWSSKSLRNTRSRSNVESK